MMSKSFWFGLFIVALTAFAPSTYAMGKGSERTQKLMALLKEQRQQIDKLRAALGMVAEVPPPFDPSETSEDDLVAFDQTQDQEIAEL